MPFTEPIDVLLYSSPKGGGNTYQSLLKSNNYSVFYTHNKCFFKGPPPVCQNSGIELEDYIKLQIDFRKNNPKLKKLKIISSWREHIEQQISFFFQNHKLWRKNIDFENDNHFDTKNVYKYIHYFNNHFLSCNEDSNNFFELFPNIELSSFTKKENYFILETHDIDFYITRYRDIHNVNEILSNIMNDSGFLHQPVLQKNSSSSKPYKELYDLFLDKYYLPRYVYNTLIFKCNFLKFLLSTEELTQYICKWNKKIDNDKTLIIKHYNFILQNDKNRGYEKFIKNNINCTLPDKVPNNYFCLIYPDKHMILKDFLPEYCKPIDEKKLENVVSEIDNYDNVFFKVDIVDQSDFYKYDTHMNLKGTLKLFKGFIDMINKSKQFREIMIRYDESKLGVKYADYIEGYGDLLWSNNINRDKIHDLALEKETFYDCQIEKLYNNSYSNVKNFYPSFSIIDKTSFEEITIKESDKIEWVIISKNILVNINECTFCNDYTVLIYYDSFTCSLLPIIFQSFKKCIMIKEAYSHSDRIIKKFNPDLIFHMAVSRFLLKN